MPQWICRFIKHDFIHYNAFRLLINDFFSCSLSLIPKSIGLSNVQYVFFFFRRLLFLQFYFQIFLLFTFRYASKNEKKREFITKVIIENEAPHAHNSESLIINSI